jgi:hypothetical protein
MASTRHPFNRFCTHVATVSRKPTSTRDGTCSETRSLPVSPS